MQRIFTFWSTNSSSWKKICQITSDEVDYLLSILGKKSYAAMDHWMPTDPSDKNDAGKFLDYLETYPGWWRYLPMLGVYELEDIKKKIRWDNWCTHWSYMPMCSPCTNRWLEWCSCWIWSSAQTDFHAIPDGDIELCRRSFSMSFVIRVSHTSWRSATHTMPLSLELLQCVLAKTINVVQKSDQPQKQPQKHPSQCQNCTCQHPPGCDNCPTWMWQLPHLRVCLLRLFKERTLAGKLSFQPEQPIHCSSGQPIERYA